jgi:homoprotocatechuate degradation regulator HpaR
VRHVRHSQHGGLLVGFICKRPNTIDAASMAPRPRKRLPDDDAARSHAEPFQYPPFARSLPMLLLAAREAVTQRFRPQTSARGLTEQQWRVVRALAEVERLEIVALSARCRIHAASLSRILPRLDKVGLISRRPDAADHRRVIVSLTSRGRRVLDEIIPESARVYQQIARDVGPERLDQVYALLEEFIRLLGGAKPAEAEPQGRMERRAPRKPPRKPSRRAARKDRGS